MKGFERLLQLRLPLAGQAITGVTKPAARLAPRFQGVAVRRRRQPGKQQSDPPYHHSIGPKRPLNGQKVNNALPTTCVRGKSPQERPS